MKDTKDINISVNEFDGNGNKYLSNDSDKYLVAWTDLNDDDGDRLKSTPIDYWKNPIISENMINKEICSDKQKENKYLHDINMKVSDSTMGYNNEEYYRNNHYLRSDEILLEDVKRDKNNKDINKGSTRKRIRLV